MITSRRDYILRIIDEVGRILARVIFKRKTGSDREALEAVVTGCERLFSLQADQIFQLTPDQQFVSLTLDEPADIARDKVLLYASLNVEAGRVYDKLGRKPIARASYLNALRFTLRAHRELRVPEVPLPTFAPDVAVLQQLLADEPLDPDTEELLRTTPLPAPSATGDSAAKPA